jgi:hypothetical protein
LNLLTLARKEARAALLFDAISIHRDSATKDPERNLTLEHPDSTIRLSCCNRELRDTFEETPQR